MSILIRSASRPSLIDYYFDLYSLVPSDDSVAILDNSNNVCVALATPSQSVSTVQSSPHSDFICGAKSNRYSFYTYRYYY